MDSDTTARLIYLSILAAAIGAWALAEMRSRLSQSLRYLVVWGLIGVGLVAGYGLWRDVQRDLIGGQAVSEAGVITLPRAQDGHFYADLMVEGQMIHFLIDTGASSIVLTKSDARRLGLKPDALSYSGQAFTANGAVRTARITLTQITLGSHADTDVTADVNDGDLDVSLLGMSYLTLYRLSVVGDQMTLSR